MTDRELINLYSRKPKEELDYKKDSHPPLMFKEHVSPEGIVIVKVVERK